MSQGSSILSGAVNEPGLREPPALEGYFARTGDAELVVVLEWPFGMKKATRLGASEREVLGLALAGLSSARIAALRGRSRRTVENQLTSIFAKVGVRGRLELFARFARLGEEAEA